MRVVGEELRPIIHELQVAPDLKSYSVQRHCAVAFNLSETITGFQDIQIHHDDRGSECCNPSAHFCSLSITKLSYDEHLSALESCLIVRGLADLNFLIVGIAMCADKWLLGLCTGNHCSGGEYGLERGNGRIVVSRMKEDGSRCAWVPQVVISIPATAAFSQFSGIAIRRNKVLIASQVGFPALAWSERLVAA